MGSFVGFVGFARMAFRHVPRPAVLRPILPIMPAYICTELFIAYSMERRLRIIDTSVTIYIPGLPLSI